MVFTIEDDMDDDVDYSPNPLEDRSKEILPTSPPPTDMSIVINAFPDDHFLNQDTSCLLGDRVVGTLGFCGALALLSTTCCCCCRGFHGKEIAKTYNKFTLFGLCCPFG